MRKPSARLQVSGVSASDSRNLRAHGDLLWNSIRRHAGILVFGLFVVTMENTLLFVGQQYTTAATASVMFSFTPIFAPIFALWLLPDERLT